MLFYSFRMKREKKIRKFLMLNLVVLSYSGIMPLLAQDTIPAASTGIISYALPVWSLILTFFAVLIITLLVSKRYYSKQIDKIETTHRLDAKREQKKIHAQTSALEKFKADLEAREQKENQLKWHTQGMVKFNEVISQYKDNMKFLSRNILTELIKYMKVEFGAIYILNDDDPDEKYIEMAAGYSLDKKRLKKTHFKIGEGNVGACFKENEAIYINNLPDGYVSVASGLGDSQVHASILMPISYDNEVLGVLELASFESIEPYRQEFLKKLSENLYSAFFTIRVSMKSEKLIFELKEQSTELKSREEEMRQNMEEMRASQEEFERKEEHYLKEIEELKSRLEKMVEK